MFIYQIKHTNILDTKLNLAWSSFFWQFMFCEWNRKVKISCLCQVENKSAVLQVENMPSATWDVRHSDHGHNHDQMVLMPSTRHQMKSGMNN